MVISALQVEKHPVTMPGPFVTPPAQRHLFHSNSAFYMTPPSRRFDTGSHMRGLELGAFGGIHSRTSSPVPPGRLGSVMSEHSGGGGGGMPLGQHHQHHIPVPATALHGSPRFGEQFRCSPKPHSSPKMKLRFDCNLK